MSEENPYRTPGSGQEHDPTAQTVTLDVLRKPAIGLIVISAMSLLMGLANMAVLLLDMPNGGTDPQAAYMIGSMLGSLVLPLIHLLILMGGIYMLKGKNYAQAKSAAIVACIPCFSPCLVGGIAFGIWAFIELRKPEVKALFES